MADLFNILPLVIFYLANGFMFLCGFYLLIDKRFDFLSDVSFSIMLIIGYLIDIVIRAIPYNFGIKNTFLRNILVILISFILGILLAIIKNKYGGKISSYIIRNGRKKSSSSLFWYDLLDENDKPIWVRLTNLDKGYYLQGILISLDETQNNPYLSLGYCKKYDLQGNEIKFENVDSNNARVRKIVRPDSFDEITILYDKNSDKIVRINMENNYDKNNKI